MFRFDETARKEKLQEGEVSMNIYDKRPVNCSSQRASAQELAEYRSAVLTDDLLPALLDAIPVCAFLLNPQRQIVAANGHFFRTFQISRPHSVLGQRLGEVMHCIHSSAGPDGCGTSGECAMCGTLRAVQECQRENRPSIKESRIITGVNFEQALDLQVQATPLSVGGYHLVVCSLRDISVEKQREALERIFFHDINNTVEGIYGLASYLRDSDDLDPVEEAFCKQKLLKQTELLLDEITHQRMLLAAERGEFRLRTEAIGLRLFMSELHNLFENHEACRRRKLVFHEIPDVTIRSDVFILRRILSNLIKNALEAASEGSAVTLQCHADDGQIRFDVHNPGVIQPEAARHLFQRVFSTKPGSGRGMGTYSVKLFTEKYLQGRVTFTSQSSEGTRFIVYLPVQIDRSTQPEEVFCRRQTGGGTDLSATAGEGLSPFDVAASSRAP